MKIHLIWAQDHNGGIGKDGNLPWHISEDLKNFKRLTSGSTILMGRNTWESLPIRPLPERRNIVLSHKEIPDVECYASVEECVETLYGDVEYDLTYSFFNSSISSPPKFLILESGYKIIWPEESSVI